MNTLEDQLSFAVKCFLAVLSGAFITVVISLVAVGAHTLTGGFVEGKITDPIRIEAPPILSCHPMSGEFSTGFILVEIWTSDDENDYPHVIRMKASEYLEWLDQPEDL